ncbi:MAG: hypothetical protein EOM18_11440 [Clostridia bacterium]|nr:hypothetical protein [Clostridia bacterium]
MEKKYFIGDIEEVLSEMDFSDVDDDIAEIDEDFMIQVSGWYLVIPSLGITVREGVACVFDEEEQMFMPDFDVTVLYEGEVDAGTWMYYEQDGIVITLANWLNGRMQIEAIERLECVLKIANTTN